MCRRLDHVGIAVADLEAAARHYTEVLGFTELERERLPHQGVEAVLLDGGNCRVELLGALGENSPIAAFLAKNREGLQHLAFETADLDAALAHLAEHGIEPIRPPSVGAGGLRVCFLHPKHTRGVLLELTEYPKMNGS
ncbi:MAG: methylmalonyl-CoA epimerase [Candidatus Krumholzibacteriota bacterium]|nr:methylmalonyl-CoA epimerase [Candidatus Krumholzibacteriota bacterium]